MGRLDHVIPKAPPIESNRWLTSPPEAEAGTKRKPLKGHRFKGTVTALVFFSVSCEASWCRIEEVQRLAERLPGLQIVGVHTPRYAHERDEQLVAEHLRRRGVGFSIVHDDGGELWHRYNPGGWPATFLVDDRGRAMGASRGLDDLTPVAEAAKIALAVQRSRRTKTAYIVEGEHSPQHTQPQTQPQAPFWDERQALAWPSGICRLGDGRLAVVDSANRVIVLRLAKDWRSAEVEQIVGWLDGPSKVTEWGPDSLVVSLPSAGKIIGVDLDAPDPLVLAEDLGRPQGLVTDRDGSIVVCDAGDDQLLRITLDGTIGVIAGTSFTGLVDGPAARAELAQPVAATRTERGIAFCDAGSNTVRILSDGGRVHTVTDGSFERFGLVDGPAHKAVLQRPTGLAVLTDGRIVIVDTGNHRLRLLDHKKVTTVAVAGLSAPEDVVALSAGVVVIADTFNHRLVAVDLDNHDVWTLTVRGLRSPTA